MDDRGANIDLLFRNGLRDYEVLPPQDVWENIQPAVRKPGYLIWFRAAASVAAIFAISLLTWMLNRDVTPDFLNSYTIFEIQESQPARLADNYPVNYAVEQNREDYRSQHILEKTEYNPQIILSEENSYFDLSGSKSSERTTVPSPQKADLSTIPENLGIRDISGEFPYEPDVPVRDNRWSISAMASPTYYSRTGTGNEKFLQMAATENAAASYAGGINLAYKVSKRFSIQTGLYYSSYGQKINGVSSFSGFSRYGAKGSSNFEVLTSNGAVRTTNGDIFIRNDAQEGKVLTAFNNDVFDPEKVNLNPVGSSLIQSFNYIQMPFFVRYKLIDRNIDFNLLGGVSYDLLVGNNAFARTDGGRFDVGDTRGLNTMIFSSSLGMGVEYNFSEKVSLNFEPTFRYFVNPFSNSAGTSIHPYSFGVFSGFSYKF